MKALSDHIGRPLAWRQPQRFRRTFDLVSPEGEPLATLDWPRRFRGIARGATAEGTLVFEPQGLFQRHVAARREGSDVALAAYAPGFFGGAVELAGGRAYRFKRFGFWPRTWALVDGAGNEVIRYRMRFRLFKEEAEATLHASMAAREETPLLVLFGWYLTLRAHRAAVRASSG